MRIKSAVFGAMFLLVGTMAAHATIIIPSTLEYMTENSNTIVLGSVVGKHSYWQEQNIYTDVTVSVDRIIKLKTKDNARMLTVRVPGGTVGDVTEEVDGAPRFSVGDKVMLFLNDRGEFIVPYGLNYGIFKAQYDAEHGVEYLNGPMFDQKMHYNLKTRDARRNRDLWGRQPLDSFVDRVRSLVQP